MSQDVTTSNAKLAALHTCIEQWEDSVRQTMFPPGAYRCFQATQGDLNEFQSCQRSTEKIVEYEEKLVQLDEEKVKLDIQHVQLVTDMDQDHQKIMEASLITLTCKLFEASGDTLLTQEVWGKLWLALDQAARLAPTQRKHQITTVGAKVTAIWRSVTQWALDVQSSIYPHAVFQVNRRFMQAGFGYKLGQLTQRIFHPDSHQEGADKCVQLDGDIEVFDPPHTQWLTATGHDYPERLEAALQKLLLVVIDAMGASMSDPQIQEILQRVPNHIEPTTKANMAGREPNITLPYRLNDLAKSH